MVLGNPDRFSRRKTATVPADVDIDVYLSPSVCPWDYLPEGPYMIVRHDLGPISDGHFYGWEQNLEEIPALLAFSRRHMPRHMQWAWITDGAHQIVLGWVNDGSHVEWQGCEYAFQMLATSPYVSDVDIAIYETNAKERALLQTNMEETYGSQRPQADAPS